MKRYIEHPKARTCKHENKKSSGCDMQCVDCNTMFYCRSGRAPVAPFFGVDTIKDDVLCNGCCSADEYEASPGSEFCLKCRDLFEPKFGPHPELYHYQQEGLDCGGSCKCGPSSELTQAQKCRIYRLHKDLPLPSQANPGDAGWDVVAAADVSFLSREKKFVPLGIIAEAPKGFHWKLFLRSSMAKAGWTLSNSVGIIDHKYAGPEDEIKALITAPNWESKITRGQRICQMILEKNYDVEWVEQEDKNFAGSSRGGFGSSGA